MSQTESRAPKRIAAVVIASQVALVLGGWLFRATLYWKIPVAKGDPYGPGDLLDLLFSFAVLGSSAVALASAALLAAVRRWRRWRLVAALAFAGLVATPLFAFVHPHVPQLVRTRAAPPR